MKPMLALSTLFVTHCTLITTRDGKIPCQILVLFWQSVYFKVEFAGEI
jgi:hypothetical protein